MTTYCKHPEMFDCIYCKLSAAGVPENKLTVIATLYYKDTKKSYSGHGCEACRGIDEPYMLKNRVWKKVSGSCDYLCLNCAQVRLGRALVPTDFMECPINYGSFGFDCRTYAFKKPA